MPQYSDIFQGILWKLEIPVSWHITLVTLPPIISALAELWDMRMSALFLRENFEKYVSIFFKWSREGVSEDCPHILKLRERSWCGWRINTSS